MRLFVVVTMEGGSSALDSTKCVRVTSSWDQALGWLEKFAESVGSSEWRDYFVKDSFISGFPAQYQEDVNYGFVATAIKED